MTRQTAIAFVSAVCFIAMAAALALLPVNFITYSPGQAHAVLGEGAADVVKISGAETYPTEGTLDLTTVSVTTPQARLTLPEALLAYALPHRDVLPRDSQYSPGKSAEQVQTEEKRMMVSSQSTAIVAGLRAGGVAVTERPVIASVTVGGPNENVLEPGDLILKIKGSAVRTTEQVTAAVQAARVGDTLTMDLKRNGREIQVRAVTAGSNQDPAVPVVGIVVSTGYDYAPTVSFGIDDSIGGPSAGLVFALAVYDTITPGALVRGTVAGTGTISADGEVGQIGGIRQKLVGAQQAGATVFLTPASNCADLGDPGSTVIVKVDTLDGAIGSLKTLDALTTVDQQSATAAGVPTC